MPQVSRKYFPSVGVGFSVRSPPLLLSMLHGAKRVSMLQDPRVTLNICDGLKFVAVW